MTGVGEPDETPEARAHVLVEQLVALLHDCRRLLPQLEAPRQDPESASAEAERVLYFALVGALEAALVRAMEDILTVLRRASQPLGPRGAEWMRIQERWLGGRLSEREGP